MKENLTSDNDLANIDNKDLEKICAFFYNESGILLNSSKRTMIESRLGKRLHDLKINSYKEYISLLESHAEERVRLINALTTNKTEFFRESDHFDFLTNQYLPQFHMKKANKKMRIWSAACSSGEEVYSLALILSEFFEKTYYCDFKILGTDINTSVLDVAEKGVYSDDTISTIQPALLKKYFMRGINNNQGCYKIRPEIMSVCKFRKFNIIKDVLPVEIRFDVIFCRNILIYFKQDMIELIVNRLYRMLNEGGLLFIGHSESLIKIEHKFKNIGSAIYMK